jgi:hypothetical protein
VANDGGNPGGVHERAPRTQKEIVNFTVFAVVLVQVFGIQVSIAVPH